MAVPNGLAVVKEYIRDNIDMIDVLDYYEVPVPSRALRYDKIRMPCCIHDGDNPSGMYIDLNRKKFVCFTHHCGDNPEDRFDNAEYSGANDVFLFIKLMEEKKARSEGREGYKCSFLEALSIAAKIAKIDIDGIKEFDSTVVDIIENRKWVRQIQMVNSIGRRPEPIDEDAIEYYRACVPLAEGYLKSRRLSEEIIDEFEIGYSPDGVDDDYCLHRPEFPGRIIFPVRDDEGRLVGWSGRLATDDKMIIRRFHKWHHKMNFEKGLVLYNFHKAKPYIKESKKIILVEGTFDVSRLWSYDVRNVVGILGSSLAPEQLSLIISHALKVYVMLDGDGAGATGAKRICQQLRLYSDVYIPAMPQGKDPDDMTYEEVMYALDNVRKFS